MSYTLIDYFKAFHSLKQELHLSASAQAAYFSILGEFNAARFPDKLSLSDRELRALSGLKSVATAHDAKRILKNSKLIDFTSKRGAYGYSEYRLSTEHLPNIKQPLTEHLPNNSRTIAEQSSRSNVISSNNVFLDGRRETLDERPSTITTTVCAGAGACVNRNANGNRTLTEHLPNNAEMDVHELWEYETGYQLTGSIAYELEELENRYGQEAFHAALKKAVASNSKGKVTFNYFKAVLENKEGKTPKKGGEKGGKPGELHYDEPDADTVYPWDAPEYASLFGGEQGTSQGDKTASAQAVRLFRAR